MLAAWKTYYGIWHSFHTWWICLGVKMDEMQPTEILKSLHQLITFKTIGLVHKIKPHHAVTTCITNQIDRRIYYVFGVTLFLQSEYGNGVLVPYTEQCDGKCRKLILYYTHYRLLNCSLLFFYVSGRGYSLYFFDILLDSQEIAIVWKSRLKLPNHGKFAIYIST